MLFRQNEGIHAFSRQLSVTSRFSFFLSLFFISFFPKFSCRVFLSRHGNSNFFFYRFFGLCFCVSPFYPGIAEICEQSLVQTASRACGFFVGQQAPVSARIQGVDARKAGGALIGFSQLKQLWPCAAIHYGMAVTFVQQAVRNVCTRHWPRFGARYDTVISHDTDNASLCGYPESH